VAQRHEPAGLALRLAAAQRLRAVLGGEHFSPLAAAELPDGRDRALANRLVTTALRRHGQLDAIIAELLEKGLPPRSGSFEAVLRLSLAQLVFLPDLGAHSALFLAVEAVKRDGKARHLAGLMNAVLRKAQANSARYGLLDDALLLPAPFRERWTAAYGAPAVAGLGILAGAASWFAWMMVRPYFLARMQNLVWNRTRIGPHRFVSRVRMRRLWAIRMSNFLLVLATLGLFLPFAKVRLARYRLQSVEVAVLGDLDRIEGGERERVSAFGEEAADLFDLDIGI